MDRPSWRPRAGQACSIFLTASLIRRCRLMRARSTVGGGLAVAAAQAHTAGQLLGQEVELLAGPGGALAVAELLGLGQGLAQLLEPLLVGGLGAGVEPGAGVAFDQHLGGL